MLGLSVGPCWKLAACLPTLKCAQELANTRGYTSSFQPPDCRLLLECDPIWNACHRLLRTYVHTYIRSCDRSRERDNGGFIASFPTDTSSPDFSSIHAFVPSDEVAVNFQFSGFSQFSLCFSLSFPFFVPGYVCSSDLPY